MIKDKELAIVAEIGSVHDGSLGQAKSLIDEAYKCGADAVKFQTHIAEEESLPNAPSPKYFNIENRFDYFKRTAFTLEQTKELYFFAKKRKLDFFSSPFSIAAVNLLEKVGVKYYKIASGEVTNTPLLERISQTKKDIFLSTGMSTISEIKKAYKILKNKDNKVIIMQCTSAYPCKPKEVGINFIDELKNISKFVGFSDHTLTPTAAILSVTKGCKIIEKHFTLSKKMYGSDAKFAMEPKEFKFYCDYIREAIQIFDSKVSKKINSDLMQMRRIFQKSIVFSKDLKKKHKITIDDLSFKKPGTGILASNYKEFLGKMLNKDCKKNEFVKRKFFT